MANKELKFGLAATAMALSVGLTACGGGDSTTAVAPAPLVPPTTPSAPTLQDKIAARTHYFGAENVDATTGEIRQDLVVMSWLSNTTYAVAIKGKVVLLDASLVRREEVPGRTPTTLGEMVNIMPSYIVLGKAAPGYADLAANIAFRTNAVIVGAAEHCEAVEQDARRQQNWNGTDKLLKCSAVVPKDQDIGSKVNVMALNDLGLCVRAIKHTDKLITTTDPTLPALSFDWSAGSDLRDAIYWPAGKAATDGISTTGSADSPSVLYQFSLPSGFTLTWNDRAGSVKTLAPSVLPLLRNLPKTDVHVGSVDVLNANVNGLRDAAAYVQATQPKVFFPSGHDAASQRAGAYNTSELMRRALEQSMLDIGVSDMQKPELRVDFDPTDYSKPHFMTFDPAASGWNQVGDRTASGSCQ